MERRALGAVYQACFVIQVSEDDCGRGAGRLAGRDHFAVADAAVLFFRLDARAADALHAVGAFLHHPAHAHGDFRVLLRLQRFFFCGVIKKIEAAHLVRTVLRAEACADAAVVDLHVQPFAVVHRRLHRAHILAGGVFAMHAGHRLE